MTIAFNVLAIFVALCILAAFSLVVVIVRETTKLLGLLRDTQAEVRSTAQAMMPHVKFEGDKDQSEVKLAEGWDEKNDLRD